MMIPPDQRRPRNHRPGKPNARGIECLKPPHFSLNLDGKVR
jgi:hypothetical protein